MDYSLTATNNKHTTHTVAPDGWCFDCGVWAVPPDAKQTLKDAQNWLSCVKGRHDPQTRLIRALAECLEIRLAYYEDHIATCPNNTGRAAG